MTTLALAQTKRRRHGAARWNPGAKNSAMERNLPDFIETAEEEHKALLQRRAESVISRRTDVLGFKEALST